MIRQPERLGGGPFDLLIIGGGIVGAGIARDAALRGLSVALVEQGDFVSGTSSKTTKLIHGGIRYLEQFDLQLVREACRERRTLLTLAPHLVKPLPFLIPVYRGGPRPAWKVRAGVLLYDWLAGRARLGPPAFYSPRRLQTVEPSLPEDRLQGAAQYYDAQMDDVRLCLENIFGAAEAGAVVVNYARVTGMHRQGGRICGAEVQAGRGSWVVQAKVVVNAAGPWADEVRRLADPQARPVVRRTKGIHLVYPKLPIRQAIVCSAGRDGRIFFVIPWRDWTLVGTTDTEFDGSPEQARATTDDVTYLLEETNRLLPKLRLQRERIVTTFAGVRPLADQGNPVPWHASRSHRIHEDANGLLTIVGGKYTTYRSMAEEVVDRVVTRVGWPVTPCRTAVLPLGGRDEWRADEGARAAMRELLGRGLLHPESHRHLIDWYGARCHALVTMIQRDPRLAAPLCPSSPHLRAQVRYAVEQEAATTLSDLLWRRLEMAWAPCQGLDCAQAAAELMADLLGWDAAGIHRQVETYRTEVRANQPVL